MNGHTHHLTSNEDEHGLPKRCPHPEWLDLGHISPCVTRLPDRRRSKSLGEEPVIIITKGEEVETGLITLAPSLPTIHSQQVLQISGPSPTSEQQREQIMMEEDLTEELLHEAEEDGNPIYISILYGFINATIVLPVVMSFGTIIYRDDFFQPYLTVLIRLTVVSGVVHQLCFSSLSTLPFAVGSVQDAGLIFLSSMARNIVQYCKTKQTDDESILATVTIALGIATALLGFGLVGVGRLRLAQYVQMLPTPVIGGYLAFIGWFCGVSGVRLMLATNSDAENDVSSTVQTRTPGLALILPGLICGLGIYVAVRKLRHMAVLPTCIVIMIVGFYLVLFATGTSVEEAIDAGWIRRSDPPPSWNHTWDYLQVRKVVWSALPPQIFTLLSMIFVVALSSSLDVAAIELELNRPLNYNHELKMVGISNVISGLMGGYTGSYIFSQSIFSLRAGIRSRLAGYVLSAVLVFFLLLPIPVLSYVPNLFFGSLLVMICIDLMYEWLWDVREKVNNVEYVVCLTTFCLIQLVGVEFGILGGVGVYLTCHLLGFEVRELKVQDEQEGAEKLVPLCESLSASYDYGAV
jgi:SulP family sulfate permease